MSDLGAHRRAVTAALERLGLDWDAWPDLIADAPLTRDERLSAVLVLISEPPTRDELGRPEIDLDALFRGDIDDFGRVVHPWRTLARQHHPWTAETAALALGLAVAGPALDERRVALAVRGVAAVCRAGQADARLLDTIELARKTLLRQRRKAYGWWAEALVDRLLRARAAAAPPQLLDLSLIADGDTWGGPARAAARAQPADEVVPLVRLLGGLGEKRPSATWRRDVAAALNPAALALLRAWVEAALAAMPVSADHGIGFGYGPSALFVGGNQALVAATVRATGRLADHEPPQTWVAPALETLALRGARHNGVTGFPEALALRVAHAAVDTLIERGGPADLAALRVLRGRLTRRDLLAKVERTLDPPVPTPVSTPMAPRSSRTVPDLDTVVMAEVDPLIDWARLWGLPALDDDDLLRLLQSTRGYTREQVAATFVLGHGATPEQLAAAYGSAEAEVKPSLLAALAYRLGPAWTPTALAATRSRSERLRQTARVGVLPLVATAQDVDQVVASFARRLAPGSNRWEGEIPALVNLLDRHGRVAEVPEALGGAVLTAEEQAWLEEFERRRPHVPYVHVVVMDQARAHRPFDRVDVRAVLPGAVDREPHSPLRQTLETVLPLVARLHR